MCLSKKDVCMCIMNLVVAEKNSNNRSNRIKYDFTHYAVFNHFISSKNYNSALVYAECIADRSLMSEDFLEARSDISKAIYKDIERLRSVTNWNDYLIAEKIGADISNGKYKKYLRGD